jgi:hypothetical protein
LSSPWDYVVRSSPGLGFLARGRLALPKPECLDPYHRYESILGQAVTHCRYLIGGKREGNRATITQTGLDSGDISHLGMATIPTSAGISGKCPDKIQKAYEEKRHD